MALLNLPAVAKSLREVQARFDSINWQLNAQRDPLSDEVISNLLDGYAHVNVLIESGIDVFAMGNHHHLLELNATVLCGAAPGKRIEFAQHTAATERRFYEEREGGIEDIVEWRSRHLHESAWKRAAGIYVRILSKPQLFIEGNHRTGALIMSYVLLNDSKPPFVLTVENALAYFKPSTVIRDTRKFGPIAMFRLPGIKSRFARFLEDQANSRYLLAPDACAVPG